MDIKTGRGADQFMVRFPPNMRDLIRDTADQNGRSMNAEIIARLAQTFTQGDGWTAEDVIKRLVLAMDPVASDEERAAARFQALTFLAGTLAVAPKAIKAWEQLRPSGANRRRLSPHELAEIDGIIDAMVTPELDSVVYYLQSQGWRVEPPDEEKS